MLGIRMNCKDCVRFNLDTERCKDNKLNPLNWETAVNVAQTHGVRTICIFNDFREHLIHVRLLDVDSRVANRASRPKK
jgi:hypothetical protein